MALTGLTFDPIQVYGKEWKLLLCSITAGTSGAVASVDGKGWKADGTAGAGTQTGSVTKETTAGQYTIVTPGLGSVHKLVPLAISPVSASSVEGGVAIDVDAGARSVTIQLFDADGAAADLASGEVVHVALLVKNTDVP